MFWRLLSATTATLGSNSLTCLRYDPAVQWQGVRGARRPEAMWQIRQQPEATEGHPGWGAAFPSHVTNAQCRRVRRSKHHHTEAIEWRR